MTEASLAPARARLALAALLMVFGAGVALAEGPRMGAVTALRETEPVDLDPDDPAIWVNPADPAQSRVIGTDKDYGLVVFDLEGRIVQRLPDGRLNNVDLRADVALGADRVTLVAASRRNDNTIVLYTMGADGVLVAATPFKFAGAPQPIDDDIYGIGLYRAADGAASVIASFKTGDIVQWRIGGTAAAIELSFARQWTVPSQPEGVAADDGLGFIYVGEEDGGIWRFDADPEAAAEGVQIDAVGSTCLPRDDVEGISIYDAGGSAGYVVVSAQGVNRYALYPRQPDAAGAQPCIGSFSIETGATDPVGETDGLDVTSSGLGPEFPDGLLVVQDDRNEGFSRNFKYVSWTAVKDALALE
jgi:3-phytase